MKNIYDPDDDEEEEQDSVNESNYDTSYWRDENIPVDDDDEKCIRRYCKREWSDGA